MGPRTARVSRRGRLLPSSLRAATFAALMSAITLCVHAQAASPCPRMEVAQRTLPDPAVCLGRAGIPVPGAAADKAAAVAALFAHEKTRMAAGRFDEAGAALDCVEAVLGDTADASVQYGPAQHELAQYELVQYELVRRRGIVDYRSERIPEALQRRACTRSPSASAARVRPL